MDERDEALAALKSDDLKKVFKFFESKSNHAVIYVFEALVGLMRGHKLADNVSVELYTQKFDGFIIGLQRIDLKGLEHKFC